MAIFLDEMSLNYDTYHYLGITNDLITKITHQMLKRDFYFNAYYKRYMQVITQT